MVSLACGAASALSQAREASPADAGSVEDQLTREARARRSTLGRWCSPTPAPAEAPAAVKRQAQARAMCQNGDEGCAAYRVVALTS
jgi:hypothetical protein